MLEPPHNATALMDSFQELNVFLLLRNVKHVDRYGLISVEEGKDHILQHAGCIPAHAAQEAIDPFCRKSPQLTDILLVFYLDSQVFFCKAAFWISSPQSFNVARDYSLPGSGLCTGLIDFHEVPAATYLQLVKIHLLARRKEICHRHLKQLTGEKQLNLLEEWKAENVKSKNTFSPFPSKTSSSSTVLPKGFYNINFDSRQNMKLIKASHVSN